MSFLATRPYKIGNGGNLKRKIGLYVIRIANTLRPLLTLG